MPDLVTEMLDDTHAASLLPAAEFLLEEVRRHSLEETEHLLGVAIEALKEEVFERMARTSH